MSIIRTKKENKKLEKNEQTAVFTDLFERYTQINKKITTTDIEKPKTETKQ